MFIMGVSFETVMVSVVCKRITYIYIYILYNNITSARKRTINYTDYMFPQGTSGDITRNTATEKN